MIVLNLSVGSKYPIDRRKLRTHVAAVLKMHGIFDAELNISVVGERKIKELNEKYLKHEGVTDVLSFPQYDRGSEIDFESTLDPKPTLNEHGVFVSASSRRHLGDVVVCFPVAVSQAMKRGRMVDEVILELVEHSLQHLLGIHHE